MLLTHENSDGNTDATNMIHMFLVGPAAFSGSNVTLAMFGSCCSHLAINGDIIKLILLDFRCLMFYISSIEATNGRMFLLVLYSD